MKGTQSFKIKAQYFGKIRLKWIQNRKNVHPKCYALKVHAVLRGKPKQGGRAQGSKPNAM